MRVRRAVVDTRLVCSLNHKAGSFFINNRLQRHLATLVVQPPSQGDLALVFGAILQTHLVPFSSGVQQLTGSLVAASIGLSRDVAVRFKASAVRFHYVWAPLRDLASIFEGLCLTEPSTHRTPLSFARLW